MEISQVVGIIHMIAGGFEENAVKCLSDHRSNVINTIHEQMYSGRDGNDKMLSPTYDDDPFFNSRGIWFGRSAAYKAWKRKIQWPHDFVLGLPERPDNVPNLFIDGTFYSQINATVSDDALYLDPGSGNGPAIVTKYGDAILNMGPSAVEYFNRAFMLPAIETFFKDCGYL